MSKNIAIKRMATGTQFTCFTSAKVQILTQKATEELADKRALLECFTWLENYVDTGGALIEP